MKIKTNFDKDKEIFAFPVLAIAYNNKEKELVIVFMFAYWAFGLSFIFK